MCPIYKQSSGKHSRITPQYQGALLSLDNHQRALMVEKDAQRWKLDLTANTTFRGNNSGPFLTNNAQSVGLSLTIPINDLPRQERVLAAKVNLDKTEINLSRIRRELISNVTNLRTQIQHRISQINYSRQAVKLALRSYKIEIIKQRAGRSTALVVAQTQNRLINTKISLISSKIAYLNAMAQLQQKTGTTLEVWGIKTWVS